MEQEERKKYIRAGEAVQDARKTAREISEPGINLRKIANTIEEQIREEGLQPAFPVNLSIDDEAAHYTPSQTEERKLKPDDVLKIDIGAHNDGYIADTALTVNPSGNHQEDIEVVEELLKKALEFLEPGVTVSEFGEYVESQIPEGYEPVRNLTGHYLGRFNQHAGVSIPNISNANSHEFKAGDAVAIEPFLTDGSGKIKQGKKGNIYKLEEDRNLRGRMERKLLGEIKNFNGLPFTTRWLDSFGGRKKMAMKKMVDAGIVHSYPVLKEVASGNVVQAEHTVLIGEDDNTITTRR